MTREKRKPGPKLDEGEELRGWLVALEPTQEQALQLLDAQRELMAAWNVLVISRETHMDHCYRWADDTGAVGARPDMPYGPRRPKRERDAVFSAYAKALGTWKIAAIKAAMKADPGRYGWDAWRVDYKRLGAICKRPGNVTNAQVYLSLVQTFRRTKGPRMKDDPSRMPLLNRTGGVPVTLLDHDPEWDGNGPSKRCVIQFGMGPMRIRARYWRNPPGTLINGVAITLRGNRWMAACKVRDQPRERAKPTKKIVAINLGLEVLCATSDGHIWPNPRGNEYTLRMSELQRRIESATDEYARDALERQRRGMAARFARKTQHVILEQILPTLGQYQTIAIHESTQEAAQGVQCRLSPRLNGGYVSAMSSCATAILMRFGGSPHHTVREVESYHISGRCSQCGDDDRIRWHRSTLRGDDKEHGTCGNPSCRARIHVDVNAARNVLHKYLDLQCAAE